MADPVTPIPGVASQVTVGGTPVTAVNPGPNGGFIQNPASAVDQGFGVMDIPENLYVNIVEAATLEGNGTTVAIYPGGVFSLVAGQTTPTSVNAATGGHKFSVVSY